MKRLTYRYIAVAILIYCTILSIHISLPQNNNTIILTQNGFTPPLLRINQGETVEFKTNNDTYFWPASNNHPRHEDYSEFDSQRPIKPGKSWRFTFKKSGEWQFHDHLSPSLEGKIIVGEPKKKSNISRQACEKNADSTDCRKYIGEYLEKNGSEKTMILIAELYETNIEFAKICHNVAHDIGIAAYRIYTKNGKKALTPKGSYCAFGFYHGFMEAFLGSNKNPAEAGKFCEYVGELFDKEAPHSSSSCYHGIGHGAIENSISYTKYNYNEKEMAHKAIAMCEMATRKDDYLYRCSSGVFNGIANFYLRGDFGLKPKANQPLWICDLQINRYKESCYGNMNVLIQWISNNDFHIGSQYIEEIKDDQFAIPAIKYLAGANILPWAKNNPEYMIEGCRKLRPTLHLACIEGFADGFLENGSPENQHLDAIKFCESAKLTNQELHHCLNNAFNLTSWYSTSKIKTVCLKVKEQYRSYCHKNPALNEIKNN